MNITIWKIILTEPIQYEDDVAYIINQTTYVNKNNSSQIISSNDIEIAEANNNYQRAHPENIEIEFTGYPMN